MTSALSWLISTVLNWALTKVLALVGREWKQHEDDAAIDKAGKEAVKEEQDAKEPSDMDRADSDVLSGGRK